MNSDANRPRSVLNRKSKIAGAALAEFAVAAPFIFIMFALVVDGGFLMYRYLRLRHITNQVAREMATTAAVRLITQRPSDCTPNIGPTCCTVVQGYACSAQSNFYNSATDVIQRGINFSVQGIAANPWRGIPLITVRGTVNSPCLFCRLFSTPINLTAISVVAFEVEGYNGLSCTSPLQC